MRDLKPSFLAPRRTLVFKAAALFLSITFMITGIPSGMPAAAAQISGGVPGVTSSHSSNTHRSNSGRIQDFSLPPSLGIVEHIFFGKPAAQNRELEISSGPVPRVPLAAPFIVLIQDAHSVPDVQKSIRGLIEHLNREWDLRHVGVEGAAGNFDTAFLKSYPDRAGLETALKFYLDRGELSGAAAAAIAPGSEMSFLGLEDAALYEENLRTYFDAQAGLPGLDGKITGAMNRLSVLKDQVYSPELRELDRLWEDWEKHDKFSEDAWRRLTDFLAGRKLLGGESFPHLTALYREISETKPSAAIENEIRVAFKKLKAGHLDREALKTLNAREQDERTGRTGASETISFLKTFAAAQAIELEFSEGAGAMGSRYALIRKMRAGDVMRELQTAVRDAKETLFRSEADRMLDALCRRAGLLYKLAHLKLSREEWEELENGPPAANPDRISREAFSEMDASRFPPEADPPRSLADVLHPSFSAPNKTVIASPPPKIPAGAAISDFEIASPAWPPRNDKAKGGLSGALNMGHEPFLQEMEMLESNPAFASARLFYQIALKRDETLLKNLLAGMEKTGARTAVMVTGGFHRDGIAKQLEDRNIAYASVSPAMTALPGEELYGQHMRGDVSWKDHFEIKNGRIELQRSFERAVRDKDRKSVV